MTVHYSAGIADSRTTRRWECDASAVSLPANPATPRGEPSVRQRPGRRWPCTIGLVLVNAREGMLEVLPMGLRVWPPSSCIRPHLVLPADDPCPAPPGGKSAESSRWIQRWVVPPSSAARARAGDTVRVTRGGEDKGLGRVDARSFRALSVGSSTWRRQSRSLSEERRGNEWWRYARAPHLARLLPKRASLLTLPFTWCRRRDGVESGVRGGLWSGPARYHPTAPFRPPVFASTNTGGPSQHPRNGGTVRVGARHHRLRWNAGPLTTSRWRLPPKLGRRFDAEEAAARKLK